MSRFVFILFVMICSFKLQARPLNTQEQLSLLSYERSLNIMSYMIQEIDPRLLNFRQRLNLEVTKRSCAPVTLLLEHIQAAQELEDQSQNLFKLMYGCLSGVVNMTDLYRLQSQE